MKTKKFLKKINNNAKSACVKTFACHCGCQGKPVSAGGNGYLGQYL